MSENKLGTELLALYEKQCKDAKMTLNASLGSSDLNSFEEMSGNFVFYQSKVAGVNMVVNRKSGTSVQQALDELRDIVNEASESKGTHRHDGYATALSALEDEQNNFGENK